MKKIFLGVMIVAFIATLVLAYTSSQPSRKAIDEFPWEVLKETDSEIKSGILHVAYTRTSFQDKRPRKEVMAEVKEEIRRLEMQKAPEGMDDKRYQHFKSSIIEGVRKNALERMEKDDVRHYEADIMFSGENFKLIPDWKEDKAKKNFSAIVYKSGDLVFEYDVQNSQVMIRKFNSHPHTPLFTTSHHSQGFFLDEWMGAGRKGYLSKLTSYELWKMTLDKGLKFSAINEGKDVRFWLKNKKTKGWYTDCFSPNLGYVLVSTETGKFSRNYRWVTNYESYSSEKPYVPKVIARKNYKKGRLVSELRSTLVSSKWNVAISDEEFRPSNLPLVDVQDERFGGEPLRYKAKGKLPSDEEVEGFRKNPQLMQ